MPRILVIEDEESIRRLLRYDLKQAGYEVETAADGEEGLHLALASTFDVIIVDWMLPHLSGVEIVEKLRGQRVKSILMMVTAKDEEQDVLDAFEAGVDDYLVKPFSPRELTARIAAHLRRSQPKQNEEDMVFGNLTIRYQQHVVLVDQTVIELTKKEYDLLLYLCSNINRVLSREQILNEIWNFDYDGDTRIVDVHIFKLRTKLEKAQLMIQSLRGVGYVAKIED